MLKISSKEYIPFGYLLKSDEQWLADKAKSLPKDATVLEIGTFLGRSTQIIALSSPETTKIYTIDLMDIDRIVKDSGGLDEKDILFFQTYEEILKEYWPERMSPKITKIVGDSKTVEWDKEVDMLFIDGDHTTEYIINDIERFSPFVKSGGLVSGHDFMVMEHVINQHVRDNKAFRDFGFEPSRNLWYAIKK